MSSSSGWCYRPFATYCACTRALAGKGGKRDEAKQTRDLPPILRELLGLSARAGVGADLATPTAAPPAWMSVRYPDVLPVDVSGVLQAGGLLRMSVSARCSSHGQLCAAGAEWPMDSAMQHALMPGLNKAVPWTVMEQTGSRVNWCRPNAASGLALRQGA